MDIQEIADIIKFAESKYNVHNWEIDGIRIWPFIRIENYSLLSYKVLCSAPANTRSYGYITKIIKSKFDKIKHDFEDRSMRNQNHQADVIFYSDGVSFTFLNNKWYDRFCDPIRDYYKTKNITTISFVPSHLFLTPRYSTSIFIQTEIDNIIIRSLIRNIIKKGNGKSENWGDYDNFVNDEFVRQYFAKVPSKTEIRIKIYKIKKLKQYFLNKLKKLKPKIAYIVSYYHDTGMAFISACKSLGIKTIDIQHGVQGPLHLAYGNWTKVPSVGYDSLPDYFWVWSETEKMAIEDWNRQLGTHQAIIGGNLFGNIWKNGSNHFVKSYDSVFQACKYFKNKQSILITLSPNIDNEEFMGSIWNVVKITNDKYNWFIRLHPVMTDLIEIYSSKILEMGISRFEMDQCTTLPLYAVLRNVDLHITAQSSTVIEADEFGIRSIISTTYGASLYNLEIQKGTAFYCKTSEEIQNKIVDLLSGKSNVKNIKSVNNNNAFSMFDQILNHGG